MQRGKETVNTSKKLFTLLHQELSAGREAVLCGILASQGSVPRGAGAKMLVLADGTTSGTIGGGAAEYQAVLLAQKLLKQRRSRWETYRLSPDGAGMACGGSVEVYFQYFRPADRTVLEPVLAALDSARPSWLVTEIAPDGWRMGVCREDAFCGLDLPLERLSPLLGGAGLLDRGEPLLYAEPLRRAETVYLFGGGHVARALASILAQADFRTVVWDDRPQAAHRDFFPEAAAVLCGPYEDALERLDPLTTEDYAVVMTHGHQADCAVLTQVLRTPAKYIGCIGSRKKAAAVRERLLAAGFSPADVDRVHSPIGLPTGGKTPGEIAVSVAAQLIACRWGRLDAFREMESSYAAN